MNVNIEPTTHLADRWGIKYKGQGRLHYVTGSHWLARFWIPAECIIRKVSFPDFKVACLTAGIVSGSSNEVIIGKALPLDTFERKSRTLTRRVQHVEFTDDDDDDDDDDEALEGKMQALSVSES